MNWEGKAWEREDQEFAPKRKVNNKKSKFLHHNTGSLYSLKMKRDVEYESLWGECLFYYFLEMDQLTIRYYVQPVEVPMRHLGKDYIVRPWNHIPDVLVFRQGYRPHLFQIKGSSDVDNSEFYNINRQCELFSSRRGWDYSVVFPKTVPEVIKSNVLFLWNYIKPRKNFEIWIPEIIHKLNFIQQSTVNEVARSFSARTDFRLVLPVVYHMICTGLLTTDFIKPINEQSVVSIGSSSAQISEFFEMGWDS
jgi:hypothetical protein